MLMGFVNKYIRRAVLLIFFSVLFSSFFISSPSVLAATRGGNPEIVKIQSNYTNALRVRDRAYTREIVRRPESILDMTCFGDTIAALSNLGKIFSDVKFDLGSLSFDSSLFCNLISAGINLYGPTLDAQLGAVLGGNINFGLQQVSLCLSPVSISQNLLASIDFGIDASITFAGVTCPISLSGGGGLNANVGGSLNANIGLDFDGFCLDLIPADWTCQNISAQWEGGENFSAEGNGINGGASYMLSQDLFNAAGLGSNISQYLTVNSPSNSGGNGISSRGAFSPGPGYGASAGDSSEFNHELAAGDAVLQKASNDNQNYSTPGSLNSWTVTPTGLESSSVSQIIQQMGP